MAPEAPGSQPLGRSGRGGGHAALRLLACLPVHLRERDKDEACKQQAAGLRELDEALALFFCLFDSSAAQVCVETPFSRTA